MPSVNNLTELISYLETQTASLSLVNSFVFGGLRQVIEKQHAPDNYPMVVLPPPDLNFRGNIDTIQQLYSIQLMVLQDANLLEGNAFKTRLQDMETAARQLIARFAVDFSLKPERFSMEPVEGLTHDNLYGWQISFDFLLSTTLCIDSEVWQ